MPAVALASLVAIAVGWRFRDELYLVPDRGLGYALGIAGLSGMALLLTYSVRKRARLLQRFGPARYWFEIHMLLGIVGPLAILFHANFQVRSVNAGVALASMIVVASSGFIGRFAYARVHHGLFGHRESLVEVSARADESRSALHAALRAAPGVEACVREFESYALARSSNALGQLRRACVLGHRTRVTSRRALRLLRKSPPGALAVPPETVARALRRHLALVRRVAEPLSLVRREVPRGALPLRRLSLARRRAPGAARDRLRPLSRGERLAQDRVRPRQDALPARREARRRRLRLVSRRRALSGNAS